MRPVAAPYASLSHIRGILPLTNLAAPVLGHPRASGRLLRLAYDGDGCVLHSLSGQWNRVFLLQEPLTTPARHRYTKNQVVMVALSPGFVGVVSSRDVYLHAEC